MQSPPGLYYVSDFRERTAEVLNIASLVRAHATPDCSIHDIADNLASDVLAIYPAAVRASIAFQPDLRETFEIDNLVTAECRFVKLNPRTKGFTTERDSIYEVSTGWHLPSSPQSGYVTSLKLVTRERSVSTVYDQTSGLGTRSFNSSLNRVHPTFALHEEIARFAENLHSGRVEGAALVLAQCSFYLADKQSPCKRLQQVSVAMREVTPLSGVSRTKIEALVERWKTKFDNDYSTFCRMKLRRHEYEQSQRGSLSSDIANGQHRAYLALGSNLGNRVDMIESALREMSDRKLTLLRTSALYETKPMYLEDQETFINGACEVCSTDADSHTR